MKIKISTTDKLFSRYIRFLSAGLCDRCHKPKTLQCAHFHSRRKRSVRWYRPNVAALCFTCHQYLDSNPLAKVEFFRNRMSLKEFNELNKRAESLIKIDAKAIEQDLKDKLKQIGE